jgi:hypothetical protein
MKQIIRDPQLDRLFGLLPVVYQERDAELGGPLQALLRVVNREVNVLEADIAQLYENWFVETCQDWAVPYIGDLIGYRHASPTGEFQNGIRERQRERVLVPRRDVANMVRARRRKGTLAVLEELARDVAGWPARAVEFHGLLATTQSVNHLRPTQRTISVRETNALEQLGTPFDTLAHTLDVRRINSSLNPGWYNLPNVGVFVWRLRVHSVTRSGATCLEEIAAHCYTFSPFRNDAQLYARPVPETDADHIAEEANLPVPIRRRALERHPERYVGPGRSLQVWVGRGEQNLEELKPEQIVAADLSDWLAYTPEFQRVAIDPELGRIVFHPDDRPDGVWVTYHVGFPADIGGGEYERHLAPLNLAPSNPAPTDQTSSIPFVCQVSKRGEVESIEVALERWQTHRAEQPHAIIEITDSEIYRERLSIILEHGEHLLIRAANHTRPVIEVTDRSPNRPDAFTIKSNRERPGGCLVLDGLAITGRAVRLEGMLCKVLIRDCTLVPGWGLDNDCEPMRPNEPSLEMYDSEACVRIEHSIIGSIRVRQNQVRAEPLCLHISNSIIDSTSPTRSAISRVGQAGAPFAHAQLHLTNSSIFGTVAVHTIEAENSLFMGELHVARRGIGCLRFSYISECSRTPRRYRCQPDGVEQTLREQPDWNTLITLERERRLQLERQRVTPQFESQRYGQATYARLGEHCADEITRGADDESEMGVYHNLFEPQRTQNLIARLEEFTPAGSDVGLIRAS